MTTRVAGAPRGVFSDRLSEFLNLLQEGSTPNYGAFCSFCYNPLPEGLQRCDHCGQSIGRTPLESIPQEVIDMHRRKLKRESLVVNSFAYVGLALALALFLGMVAINVLYMEKAFWFFVLSLLVLMIGSRVLPGLIGGWLGDEIGYRYANKHLAEDWTDHVTHREALRNE